MTYSLTWGLSWVSGAQIAPCPVRIRFDASQEVRINIMGCCSDKFEICVKEAADKSYTLTGPETDDYSGASEIYFIVRNSAGTKVIDYSLTGGELSQPTDYQIAFALPNADSGALPAGRLPAELWVVYSDGTEHVQKGTLKVEATQGYA